MSKDYGDPGPDLLRPRDNAQHQAAENMGSSATGFYLRTKGGGQRDDWRDWSGKLKRGEVLRRIDEWQGKAGNGAKLQVGRLADGKPKAKNEVLAVDVREVNLANVHAGPQMVADLAREQFPGLVVGGFSCREYNGVPGSGWSDHAWGDAVDLSPGGGSPGPNDKLSDWCVRMAKAGCMGSCAQFIGSKGGAVYAWYAPSYNASKGGPVSHLTHVHASYRQHYGANPRC
jgi:hypothetical protein